MSDKLEFFENIYRLTTTDGLTRVYNKLYFVESLESACDGALALLIVDVDGLKRINDQNGVLAGDYLLQQLAQRMQAFMRDEDILARISGQRFAALLPAMSRRDALVAAERIRVAVAESVVVFDEHEHELRATISIGVAAHEAGAVDRTGLVAAAEAKLDQAKRAGRNRVVG